MAYSEKIIEAAKDLYLTVNDKGERQYSFNEISQELLKIFPKLKHKTFTSRTIQNWAKQDNWEIDFQTIKSLGKQKAIQITNDKEKTLTDAKTDDIAERRIISKEIKDKADKLLLMTLDKMIESGENEIDLRILQQISAQREDVIQNLDGMKQPESAIQSRLEKLLSLYGMN